jgi:circadian clock protein KaiC
MSSAKPKVVRTWLAKAPTGIQGLDEVTGGGLPKGRVTLVCGSAGCGKSLFAASPAYAWISKKPRRS